MPVTRRRVRWRPFGVLTMAPWWRGPFLLLRRIGVAGALLAASVVATLPAASAVPFLSSSRSATLHHQIETACQWTAGVTLSSDIGMPRAPGQPVDERPPFEDGGPPPERPDFEAAVAHRTAAANEALASVRLLGPAQTTLISSRLQGPINRPDTYAYPLFVVYREDFKDHLEIVSGSPDSGVWVPDNYAEFIGMHAGDDLTLAQFGSPVTTVSNVAIYRNLREQPHQPFWCDLRNVYALPAGNTSPPYVVFMDRESFLAMPTFIVSESLHRSVFPLTDPGLDMDSARTTVEQVDAAEAALMASRDDDLYGRVNPADVESRLPAMVGQADLVRESLLDPVAPIAAAGALVGLVVVGAAATFWVRRRRHELTMLAAHGVSSRALAIKAVAEALPALVAGAALGWGGAWVLVRWAGPDPVLSSEALPYSVAAAGATLLLQLLAVAVVAGIATRPLADQVRAHHRSVLRLLPYELLVLAAAPLAWWWLGDEVQTTSEDTALGTVIHVPGRLLVVPILVVAGLTILLARLTVVFLRRSPGAWAPRGTATFIGWRRVGRQAAMVAILASATAMPVALAAYGSVVTDSVRTTIQDEARLHVGTDVVLQLRAPAEIPAALAGQATLVQRIDGLRIGGVATDLLVVDPVEFERVVYWHNSLGGGRSMHSLLAPLREPGEPPGIVAGGKTPGGVQQAIYAGREAMGGTVEVTAMPVLPAQLGGYSVAIAARAEAADLEGLGHPEMWIRGDSEQIMAELAKVDLPIGWIFSAAETYANTQWEPLTYTFDYLIALSLLTGVVTLVGLQLYLEAQTPQRRRAYVLLRRMGLSKGSHRRALLGELALPLLAGLVGGVAMTTGLVLVVGSTFDVNRQVLPDTIIDVPYLALGIIASMTVVVGVLAASYAQARIGRAQPSEVLRDAD